VALNFNNNQQQQQQDPHANSVANFLRYCDNLKNDKNISEEKRIRFKEANFSLSRRNPQIFVKLWSDNVQESAEAMKWIKSRINELDPAMRLSLIK
jgi:hypothetical protein